MTATEETQGIKTLWQADVELLDIPFGTRTFYVAMDGTTHDKAAMEISRLLPSSYFRIHALIDLGKVLVLKRKGRKGV